MTAMIDYKNVLYRNTSNTMFELKFDNWIFSWDTQKQKLEVAYMTRPIANVALEENNAKTKEEKVDKFLDAVYAYLVSFDAQVSTSEVAKNEG